MAVTATNNTQEANEGIGQEEEMTFTTIKMGVVGNRISETLWLERFVVSTQEMYTGMLGKTKLNRATENIQALQMVYSDLEEYVNRKENARVPFTAAQADGYSSSAVMAWTQSKRSYTCSWCPVRSQWLVL